MRRAEDMPSTTTGPDRERITRNRELELHGWAKTMGTSPERLQRAVQAVGITPRKVRAWLREAA